MSDHAADFLDLHIHKGQRFLQTGTLDLQVHQKALNKYLYLPFKSFHPWSVKTGFIVTELQRYVRNSSSREAFERIRLAFFSRLRDRGFPSRVITALFNRVQYSQRATLLRPRQQQQERKQQQNGIVAFKTVFNPTSNAVPLKRVLTEHWHLLQPLTHVFPKQPIIAVAREANLKNLLCRAKL